MKKRLLSIFIFVAYCALLIKVMVFKDIPTIRIGHLMFNFSGADGGHPANFVPFKTILPYLFGSKGLIIAGINLVGNVALLVPLGLLFPLVCRNVTWKKSLMLAVASGLSIEIMQVVLRVGIFDIDDVILNALGVMIGYWIFLVLAKWIRSRSYANIIIASIIIILAIVGAFYLLFPKDQRSTNPAVGVGDIQSDRMGDEQEGEIPQSGDLCGGTGGTGEIIEMGSGTITIRRKDGVVQLIKLTSRSTIRNSAGLASESDLKIGDRVTLVVNDGETASVVLVCNVPSSEIQK